MPNIEAQLTSFGRSKTVPSRIGFYGSCGGLLQATAGGGAIEVIGTKTIGPAINWGIAANGNGLGAILGHLPLCSLPEQ